MPKCFYIVIIYLIGNILSLSGKNDIKLGADQLDQLCPLLKGKKVALVINHTSRLSDGQFLLDALLSKNIRVTKIFAPEHGFRGESDAGANIQNDIDTQTGLPVISLYGKNKKPTQAMLRDVDVVVYDIQDVGVRFYTYISTMRYVMAACAESNKPFIVLDRPNPHDYIDGPVLENTHRSFVGVYPIPVLYGLTIGELALMANGEGWNGTFRKCELTVIPLRGWKHGDPYSLPIKPSPNLPNDQSIKLYASLCFFEATNVSIGRGTPYPFQVIGYPDPNCGTFQFRPQPLPGFDTNPLQKGKVCYGVDLRDEKLQTGFTLSYLIDFYKKTGLGPAFFKSTQFMTMLSGTTKLQRQIVSGMAEDTIRRTWEKDLNNYKQLRIKYVLYQDKTYN